MSNNETTMIQEAPSGSKGVSSLSATEPYTDDTERPDIHCHPLSTLPALGSPVTTHLSALRTLENWLIMADATLKRARKLLNKVLMQCCQPMILK